MSGKDTFTLVCVNLPRQNTAASAWSTIILMIYESTYGLEVDRKGMAWDITRLFETTHQGMAGEGFGFTGTMEEQAVEGEVIAFERDANNIFVTLAYTISNATPWISEGQGIWAEIMQTLTFEN